MIGKEKVSICVYWGVEIASNFPDILAYFQYIYMYFVYSLNGHSLDNVLHDWVFPHLCVSQNYHTVLVLKFRKIIIITVTLYFNTDISSFPCSY